MDSEQPVPIGSYKGLTIQAVYLPFEKEFHAQLVGAGVYDVTLGADALGNIIRLTNGIADCCAALERGTAPAGSIICCGKICFVLTGIENRARFCGNTKSRRWKS